MSTMVENPMSMLNILAEVASEKLAVGLTPRHEVSFQSRNILCMIQLPEKYYVIAMNMFLFFLTTLKFF